MGFRITVYFQCLANILNSLQMFSLSKISFCSERISGRIIRIKSYDAIILFDCIVIVFTGIRITPKTHSTHHATGIECEYLLIISIRIIVAALFI